MIRPPARHHRRLFERAQAGRGLARIEDLRAALALGMHLLKVRYRRPLVGVMAGIPTPVASAGEDFAVALVCFAALLWPVIGLIVAALLALLAWWVGNVVRRKVQRDKPEIAAATAPQP